MPIKPWRATCIQMRSERASQAPDDATASQVIQRNIDRLVSLIEQACDSNEAPDLVVFPEFAMQGPPLKMRPAEWIARACYPFPGRLTQPLQELARRRGIFIAGNAFEAPPEWPGRYFNSSFLINRDGEIVLHYRRLNTAAFPSVHDFLSSYTAATPQENWFPVVDTELGKLCVIPCGEITIPEVARVMMMQGAEVILHPTNSKYTARQEAAKLSRVTENMTYLVSANVADWIGFSPDNTEPGGRSHILDHKGRTLAYREDAAENSAVTALIDIEQLRADRRTDTGLDNPLLRARYEMYVPFYSRAEFYPPNYFLDAPMADSSEIKGAIQAARQNLERAGILQPQSHGAVEPVAAAAH
ncbi:MAG: putative amidohydrolase [Devosia sp.]|uniref:nitrilase-related carbon-nitrogen hydrolase n=1 Tax=Devosia sp. TaxID=1871048 RepID=UPI002607D456|nr:nitrilase-related carbon-nitrogen hydrolase [Devosia sp.]MDB5531102.1 putative amidohydrolase [Devosia sp.]